MGSGWDLHGRKWLVSLSASESGADAEQCQRRAALLQRIADADLAPKYVSGQCKTGSSFSFPTAKGLSMVSQRHLQVAEMQGLCGDFAANVAKKSANDQKSGL